MFTRLLNGTRQSDIIDDGLEHGLRDNIVGAYRTIVLVCQTTDTLRWYGEELATISLMTGVTPGDVVTNVAVIMAVAQMVRYVVMVRVTIG